MNFAARHQSYGYYGHKQRAEYGPQDLDFSRPRDVGSKQFSYAGQTEDYGKPHKYLKVDSLDLSNAASGGYRHEGYGDAGGYHDTLVGRQHKTHNKENLAMQLKKTRAYHLIYDISMEEGAVLLEIWEQNHFIDFNSWLQSAKARVDFGNAAQRGHGGAHDGKWR